MKTLWLLRHAKSGSGDGLPDHERVLSRRGRDEATRIGRYLAEQGVSPDRVLCSSALRARQTLERVSEGLPTPPAVAVEEDLYLASGESLLQRIAAAPDTSGSLLVVGHNPGIGELAAELAVRGPAAERARLQRSYPTAALAGLRLDAEHWGELARGCALIAFVTPADSPD